MLVYDWLWWGQLTNQNLARRCEEVRGGVHRGARRDAQRDYHCLSLATIDLVGDNREFEV